MDEGHLFLREGGMISASIMGKVGYSAGNDCIRPFSRCSKKPGVVFVVFAVYCKHSIRGRDYAQLNYCAKN